MHRLLVMKIKHPKYLGCFILPLSPYCIDSKVIVSFRGLVLPPNDTGVIWSMCDS